MSVLLKRCFTQNIDSLEVEAGIGAEMVVAAHGNFDTARCITNGLAVPVSEVKEAALCQTPGGDKGW